MKKTLLLIRNQSIYIMFVIAFFLIVAFGYSNKTIITEDVSNARSVQAIHLVSKYNKKVVSTKQVTSFNEILNYAKNMPVKFSGTMTGYGPDCKGCGGKTGCPPSQNVKNGNIYFNDNEYGKVNILASDKRIPCGTIVKITNSTLGKEVMAVVLDRGGAIKNTKFDLLMNTEKEASKKVGFQKVEYEIVRWGW